MQAKNQHGRPAHFKTPEEMQEKIDKYFEEKVRCIPLLNDEGNYIISNGKIAYDVMPPTINGLALYLGFVNDCSIYDYENRVSKEDDNEKPFSDTIKQARSRIKEFAEQQLYIGNSTGAIFWLKNSGWKDRQDITSDDKQIDNKVAIVNSRVAVKDWGK